MHVRESDVSRLQAPARPRKCAPARPQMTSLKAQNVLSGRSEGCSGARFRHAELAQVPHSQPRDALEGKRRKPRK